MNGSEKNTADNNSSFAVPNTSGAEQQAPGTAPNLTSSEPYIPPEPKKSTKKPLIITLIIVVVLALIGGGAYFCLTTQKQEKKEDVAEKTQPTEVPKEDYCISENMIPIENKASEIYAENPDNVGKVLDYYDEIFASAVQGGREYCVQEILGREMNLLVAENLVEAQVEAYSRIDTDWFGDDVLQYQTAIHVIDLAKTVGRDDVVLQYQKLADRLKPALETSKRFSIE